MSFVFIAIGAAHALPPILGATIGKSKVGVWIGVAIAVLIAFASGNPVYVFIDLIGVAFGAWFGLSTIEEQPDQFGSTEFPIEVSALLCGTNEDELAFSADGQSVILTIQNTYCEFPDSASAQQYIKDKIYRQTDVNRAWADQLTVTHVARTEQPRSYRLTITMPRSTVLSTEYIENEIKNLGRVFIRNTSNDHRFLLFPQEARSVEVNNGKVLVRIGRVQLVPTFLGNWKEWVMSERQISRNIKNRLWNQVDVRCISIDQNTYCGEVILPARH